MGFAPNALALHNSITERKALVVECDAAAQLGLLGFLRARGYQCAAVSTPGEAFEALDDGDFSFTLVDLTGEGTDATDLIRRLRLHGRSAGHVIAVADRPINGIDAIPFDVDAVLHKPLSLDELQQAIDHLIRPQAEANGPAPEQVAGRIRKEMDLWCSSKMLDARQIIREAARVDVTVLVTGETGTGKELVARAIHHFSTRRAGPFVKVNCAAMPRELLESELFGYERGAFTGAHKLKIGKFEAAHHGTIFLDEIGDLHPALQAKLLHVLQDGEFSRVGGRNNIIVDVRVICATNRDLAREVAAGRFREDLFYRLNVINILVPPLRERREEIPGLVSYFVSRYSRVFNVPERELAPDTLQAFLGHGWPGNIRELENFIKRMIVLQDWNLARTLVVPTPATPAAAAVAEPFAATKGLSLKEISRRAVLEAEREVIRRALEQCRWNRVKTAKMLKISYRALLYKIKDMGLKQDAAAS